MCCIAEVREAFAKVLADFKIPYTRVPVETGLHGCSWLPAHLRSFYSQVEKDALGAIPVFRRYGIRSIHVRRSSCRLPPPALNRCPPALELFGSRFSISSHVLNL